jgi:hypothetical protein
MKIKHTGLCKREVEIQPCGLRWYARSRFCVVREDTRLIFKLEVKSCSETINDELGDTIGFCL